MKLIHVKRAFVLLMFFSLYAVSINSQAVRTNYFIESSYLRSNLNPALRPHGSYLGVPFLSGIGVDYKTNTFNLDNFTFKQNGERVTFMHSDISADRFLSNISDKNYIALDVNYDIFSMGFYKKDAFWNITLAARAQVDANVPKELFNLAKTGFQQNNTTSYDINNTSATANSYLELGVSYSRPFFNNSLMVGGRAKILGGIANFDLNAERLAIEAGPDQWVASSRVKLQASAPKIKPKYKLKDRNNGESLEMFNGFDFGTWGGISGFGLGFDLGGVYDFKELSKTLSGTSADLLRNLKVSLAFTDIGFISWTKGNSTHLASSGEKVTLTPNDYTIHTDGSSSLEDIFDDVINDLEQAVDLKEYKSGGRTTALRTTMNMGAEYAFLNNKLSAGLLYSLRFGNYFNTQELTVSANYRPKSWLATTVSYSFLHSNFNTIGWALYLTPSKGINFFLASDYIIPHVSPQWIPSTSKALNVQLGFSIPM